MSDPAVPLAGRCHCGAVRFLLRGRPHAAIECTCSICHARGALWHLADDAALRIEAGQHALTRYRFGTRTATHFFCRRCGIHPFARPRLDPRRWVVNLRCVDDLALELLPRLRFDGRHWDRAAAAWRARLASAPA